MIKRFHRNLIIAVVLVVIAIFIASSAGSFLTSPDNIHPVTTYDVTHIGQYNKTIISNSTGHSLLINNTIVQNSTLSHSALNEVYVNNSILSFTYVTNASINSSNINNSSLGHMYINNSKATHVLIVNGSVNNSEIKDAYLHNVGISNTVIRDSTISNAALSHVILIDSTFYNGSLNNSIAVNTNLTSTVGKGTNLTVINLEFDFNIPPGIGFSGINPGIILPIANVNHYSMNFTLGSKSSKIYNITFPIHIANIIVTINVVNSSNIRVVEPFNVTVQVNVNHISPVPHTPPGPNPRIPNNGAMATSHNNIVPGNPLHQTNKNSNGNINATNLTKSISIKQSYKN